MGGGVPQMYFIYKDNNKVAGCWSEERAIAICEAMTKAEAIG
jgi:hypothetical protein